MAPRWLRKGGRVASAPVAGVSSAGGPPAPEPSSSPPITGFGQHVTPWCACPPVDTEECPGSADTIDYYAGVLREAAARFDVPPPLEGISGNVMLAVAPAPGKVPEQWRPAGPLFIGWPHAEGADLAVEMTAAQLRDHLTTMGAW